MAGIINTKECVVKTLEELKRVKQFPYFSISNECGSLVKLLPFNLKELKKINFIFNIIANISMGITILKQNAKEVGNGMMEYVVKFIKKLQTLEEELYYHPYSLWLTMGLKMMLYNLEADYLWGLNIKDVALKRAIKYLEESQKPEFTYLVGYPAVKCERILEIFLEMNEFDLLELQLSCLKVDEDRYPGLKLLLLKYKGLLYQRKIERLEEQMKQLSSQAQLAQQTLSHSLQQVPQLVQQASLAPLSPQPLSPLLQRPSVQQSPQEVPRSPHPLHTSSTTAPHVSDSGANGIKHQEEQRQLLLKQRQMQMQLQETQHLQRLQKLQQRKQEQMQACSGLSLSGPVGRRMIHNGRNVTNNTTTITNPIRINGSSNGSVFGLEEEVSPLTTFQGNNGEVTLYPEVSGANFAATTTVVKGYPCINPVAAAVGSQPTRVIMSSADVADLADLDQQRPICLSDFPTQFSPPEEFLRYGQKKRRVESEEDLGVAARMGGGGGSGVVVGRLDDGVLSLEVVQPPVEYQQQQPSCLSLVVSADEGKNGLTDATTASNNSNNNNTTNKQQQQQQTYVDMLLNSSPFEVDGRSPSDDNTAIYFGGIAGGEGEGEGEGNNGIVQKDDVMRGMDEDGNSMIVLGGDVADMGIEDLADIEAEIETMWEMEDTESSKVSGVVEGMTPTFDPSF